MTNHLIMISEMAYPNVFFHVDMIKVLTQPSYIAPIKIPIFASVGRKR